MESRPGCISAFLRHQLSNRLTAMDMNSVFSSVLKMHIDSLPLPPTGSLGLRSRRKSGVICCKIRSRRRSCVRKIQELWTKALSQYYLFEWQIIGCWSPYLYVSRLPLRLVACTAFTICWFPTYVLYVYLCPTRDNEIGVDSHCIISFNPLQFRQINGDDSMAMLYCPFKWCNFSSVHQCPIGPCNVESDGSVQTLTWRLSHVMSSPQILTLIEWIDVILFHLYLRIRPGQPAQQVCREALLISGALKSITTGAAKGRRIGTGS